MMRPPYEEDSTSDEDFTVEPKVIWTIKKRKKRPKVEEAYNVLIKYLIINDREYVLEGQSEKVEHWTKQLMKEVFQEWNQEAKRSTVFGTNNFSGISDPSNL